MSKPNTAQAHEWRQPNAPGALPILGNISPTTTRAGEASLVLTISSSTFISNNFTYAAWNNNALITTIVDSATLSAIVPASYISLPQTAQVTIVDAGGVSNAAPFTVLSPTLVVSGVTPISASAGASVSLVITGDGFYVGTLARLNGITLTASPVSITELSALVPSGVFTVAGNYTLTVRNPGNNPIALPFSIVAGPLAKLVVSPTAITLATGVTKTFTASGADAYGNAVTPISPTWATNPAAGSITNIGTFTAGTTAGVYPGAVVATDGTITGTASVTVVATPVISSVTPLTITAGQTETLTITGTDITSGTLTQLNGITLSLVISGNQATAIVPSNTFTVVGNISLTLINSGAPPTSTLITVVAGPLGKINVSPNPVTVTLGGSQSFSATGQDAFGNAITGLTFTWAISEVAIGGSGQIDAAGNYTASTAAGPFHILASSGNVTGSAVVNVLAGPSAFISMSANPAVLISNGVNTTTITASVTDSFGNAVGAGRLVTFSASSGVITPLVGTTNSQGRATASLTKTLTSPTSTLSSVITVTALTNGAAGLQISQTVQVSTLFTPVKILMPLFFKEAPFQNSTACQAYTLTTGSTVTQAPDVSSLYYRFAASAASQAINLSGYASTGNITTYSIASDANCGTALPIMVVTPLTAAIPISGPALIQVRYSGLTVGGKYLIVINTSGGFSPQSYSLRLVL